MNPYEQAIDIIERKGWAKGTVQTSTGRVCLVGALCLATSSNVYEVCPVTREALDFFSDVTGISSIPDWNDKLERRLEEVLEELRIVAKAYANKGGF